MGRKKIAQKLNVFLGRHHVGTLTKQSKGSIEFKYSDGWIETGFGISLSLPLIDKSFAGDKAAFYFDNLLPDNKNILETIAKKVGAESTQQFDLLSAIGRECVGALSFYPYEEQPTFSNKMSVRLLKESDIAHRIKGLATDNPLGMDEGDFRLSLAGVQEKMALLYRKGKWFEPRGQSATSHILKKKMGTLAGGINFEKSIDNEWTCLFFAKEAEINTCNAEIVTFEDQKVLCVERFDRVWKDNFLHRIPQEDFCQALGVSPHGKYERSGGPSIEKMMKFLERSNNAEADRKMLFKTVMFNDLIHNTDGHAKNFSIYVTRKGFALTPMYDLLSAHFMAEKHKDRYSKLRSSLSVNGKYHFKEITLKDWAEESKKCKISKGMFEEICGELHQTFKTFKIISKSIPTEVDMTELKSILKGTQNRAKFLFS